MAQVRMPDVPVGPIRAYFEHLHRLHEAAGSPSMRELQRRTRSRARPSGINPTTIHDLFSSARLARWEVVEAIVGSLGGDLEVVADLWRKAKLSTQEAVRPASKQAERPQHVPAQLPLDAHGFSGREDELARLDTMLAVTGEQPTAVVISALSGTAGVGKTALAVHWAHRISDRFPDGQLYVNLRGFDPVVPAASASEVIRGFLDALEVQPHRIPASLQSQTDLYRSLLAGKRVLVLLDNAKDPEQVRPLLPGSPGCLVVVTSRNRLTGLVAGEGARPLLLDLLSAGEARQLLIRRLGADRVAAEPGAVDQIIARCSRLPLALTIVAARAATYPTFSLAEWASELGGTKLDAFSGDDPATDVRTVFSWSYRALSPEAARLFRLLGLHPGPDVTVPAAASLAGVQEVLRPLEELSRASLIAAQTPGRYAFHDLLRVYAAEQNVAIDGHSDRDAAMHRMLDHYVQSGYLADRVLNPHRDVAELRPVQPGVTPEVAAGHAEALAWFTAEHQVLLAVIDRATMAGFDAYAWQLSSTMTTFINRRGHWRDGVAVGEAALEAARRSGDPRAQARARREIAHACIWLRRFEDARLQMVEALRLFGEVGDLTGQGHAHRTLARIWAQRGHWSEALAEAQRALEDYRLAGHRAGEAYALNAVGWFHARLGAFEPALAYCEEALSLQQKLGDRHQEAATLDSLGYVHRQLGGYAESVACYRRGLELFEELSDKYQQADILANLGDTYAAEGRTASAQECWQRALGILDQLGHPEAERVRAKLG